MRSRHAFQELDLLELEPRLVLSSPMGPTPLDVRPPGGSVNAAQVADMDGDGRADVVLAADDAVIVRRNNGHGGFRAEQIGVLPASPLRFSRVLTLAMYVADYDGDGDNDVTVVASLFGKARHSYFRTWLLTNDGHGNLALAAVVHDIEPLYQVVVSNQFDINGDGAADFVTNAYRAFSWQNGTIVDRGTIAPEIGGGIRVDFDHDGDVDTLNLNGAGQMTLARNNGSSGYAIEPLFTSPGGVSQGFIYTDITGDGVKDFVVWGSAQVNGEPGLAMFAVPSVMGQFVPDATPLFQETLTDIRARGGHPADVPQPYYAYSAMLTKVSVGPDINGDSRPDVSFTLHSYQYWTYRETDAPEVFDEDYPIGLTAGDPTDSDGLPTFTAQPYTPPATFVAPTPLNTLGHGDIDGDGQTDYIVGRGDTGRGYGERLVYVVLSSQRLPVAVSVDLYHNNVHQTAISLAVGDRLRSLLRVTNAATGVPVASANLFIDSNNDGQLDAGDRLLRVGIEQPTSTADTTVFSFNVVRRDYWGGPGVRALFFVPYDSLGNPGAPATWMVNLV